MISVPTPGQNHETLHFNKIAPLSVGVDFTVTSQEIIYAIEGASSEIVKISPDGEVLKQTGGFGWDAGVFDSPVAIFSNILSVFVTDKNNHRIQQFDKDLNYAGSLQTQPSGQISFPEIRYPVDCLVSPQGDYFILDSENKRILKFDPFGNFLMEFGGMNWGQYTLQTPLRLLTLNSDGIGVLEKTRLLFFSSFGTGTAMLPLPENVSSASLDNSAIYCSSGNNILIKKNGTVQGSWEQYTTDIPDPVIKIEFRSGYLYVLTAKAIFKSQEKM